jgi:HAD superfamily hydrolase (TIGR01509 family)
MTEGGTAHDGAPGARDDRARRSTVLFDLDGTLVETESLKARSYAMAAAELRPGAIDQQAVIAAYDTCIGRPREEVAQTLLDRFGLRDAATSQAASLGANSPLDAFIALRLRDYETMVKDPAVIRRQELPYATALLRRLKREGYTTGLTTVSHAAQAFLVLDALGIRGEFDTIVTIDDVHHGKPDPEIYRIAMSRLVRAPAECVAVEDSAPGVQAALAAGVICVASANDLTRRSLHAMPADPRVRIVDDPQRLDEVVHSLLTAPEGMSVWN